MFLQVEKITIIYFEKHFFPIFFFTLFSSFSSFFFSFFTFLHCGRRRIAPAVGYFHLIIFSARRCRLIENICFANVNMLNIFFLSLVTRTISLFLSFLFSFFSHTSSAASITQEMNETATCAHRKKMRSRNVDKFMRMHCQEASHLKLYTYIGM